MSKKPLYILTENLNFFFRLKKELDRNSIKYKILNIGGKIPSSSSIILSTLEEMPYSYDEINDLVVLPYSKTQDFEQYVLQVIAACRIGFKRSYSSLMISIDPGTKYIGVATFLDNFFLESHTFYTKGEVIPYIIKIAKLSRFNSPKPLEFQFKFGKGVLSLSYELIKDIFSALKNEAIKNVYLIDEISSSKIRLYFHKRKFPKHESAAILLALRKGYEITEENFHQVFRRVKLNQIKVISAKSDYKISINNHLTDIKTIAENVINGVSSYKEGMVLINDFFEKQKFNLE